MAETLGAVNPLRYRGYVYDSETGFYYLQSRYYDPELGRFINSDSYASTGQGILGNNMFAYCRNNPVCRIDVTGTVDYTQVGDSDLLDPNELDGSRDGGTGSSSSGQIGYTYTAPNSGGGVSTSVQVGNTTVTFGHGGNHMGNTNIAQLESFIANDVVTRPPSLGHVTHVQIDYYGALLEYGYYTRSDTLINVGTYFFVNAHE